MIGVSFILPVILLSVIGIVSTQDDPFSCYGNVGFLIKRLDDERGALYPRSDIYVEVGKDPVTVLCRFNDAFIKSKDVYFRGQNNVIVPHEVVNSSTIRTHISHSLPIKYRLQCLFRRPKGEKSLCKQFVKAGYPPQDIADEKIHCISKNYESLNCTWRYEYNPVKTNYIVQYSVPKFTHKKLCSTNNDQTVCYWKAINHSLRDEFYIHINATNMFGSREFTHKVNIPKVVVPNKISVEVSLVAPTIAKILWNLSFPIDVFLPGLWHKVDYRMAGESDWKTIKMFHHNHPLSELEVKREFIITKDLEYSNTKYEFRVRLHTLAASLNNTKLWSDYDIYSIVTEPLPPKVAPKTGISTFEVVEDLDTRDIYVNFEAIDPKFYGGNDFKYKVLAFNGTNDRRVDVEPTESTNAYVKYPLMYFNSYRFRIWPENEKGNGSVYSEVFVPRSDCMPKKTEFFTVIIRNKAANSISVGGNKVFSLYWVPSRPANEPCSDTNAIDSYTIFWCKKTYGNRCKEKLHWISIDKKSLTSHRFHGTISDSSYSLFERNITGLPEGLHTFGVAAVSGGKYSSGIRWSSCIVDESDSIPAPTDVIAYPSLNATAVFIKWELKCQSLSAVPLGYKVEFCKSTIEDFGHCTSKVESLKVYRPELKSVVLRRNLEPGVSYIFSVSLIPYAGVGIQSHPVKVVIPEKKPTGPPLNFHAVSVTNTSAIISWKLPEESKRNGIINKFILFHGHSKFTIPIGNKKEPYKFTLENLQPYTEYSTEIVACTKMDCGGDNAKALIKFRTREGVPSPATNFDVEISNWRLVWDFKSCNNPNCYFDVRIPINDSYTIEETVSEHYLGLYEIDLPCLNQVMDFWVRPIGIDENKERIYGNWSHTSKAAKECPPATIPLWVIILVVCFGVFISAFIILVFKFGWRAVMAAIKDCNLKIDVPSGLYFGSESIKHLKKNNFNKDTKLKTHVIVADSKKEPLTDAYLFSEPKQPIPRSPKTSVSSEEIQLIPSLTERHGRNRSGSSENSSNQDSAVMSQSPSIGDQDSSFPERIMDDMDSSYVQHGMITDKIPEGYVAAKSLPSLLNLIQQGEGDYNSTPNLDGKTIVLPINARRASTGYISMPDDCVSPSHINGIVYIPSQDTHIPPKPFALIKNEASPQPGYVTLAEIPPMAKYPPEAYCKVAEKESPYVAVGENFKSPAYVTVDNWPPNISPPNWSPQNTAVNSNLTPSLSKQSSGYVSSQECLPTNGDVIISPHHLVRQKRPKSLISPIRDHSSMV